MEDLWGDDDLDADVVEECLMMATQQATNSQLPSSSRNPQEDSWNYKVKSDFEFKQPNLKSNNSSSCVSMSSSVKSFNDTASTIPQTQFSSGELERLREENRCLSEANLTRAGEASILRADVQNLKTILEKKDVESSQQLTALRRQVQQMDSNHHKQLEASKTEMKFKELELEELRNKCKRIEQSKMESLGGTKLIPTVIRESPNSGRSFLNKTAFESAKFSERKAIQTDVGIQTETIHTFRLDPSDNERLDNGPNTGTLIDTLKYSLLSVNIAGSSATTTLLEQLRVRIIVNANEEDMVNLLHRSEPSVVELVCNNLERVKNTERFNAHLDFLCCWINHILPLLEQTKSDSLIQSLLSEIKRFSFHEILQLCSVIVARFGLATVCNKQSGCLLEKAALQLKDSYASLSTDEQHQAAQKLVLSLSSMIASPPSENLKKCACIAHLLKALTMVIQQQVELDCLSKSAEDRRLNLLVQAFRLSLSILHSRTEPWLTFVHTPAEVNRLFTILTSVSVDFSIPKELSQEINVAAFYTGSGI